MLAHHDRALCEILEEAPQEKQSLTVPRVLETRETCRVWRAAKSGRSNASRVGGQTKTLPTMIADGQVVRNH